jgi:hypothetical protein
LLRRVPPTAWTALAWCAAIAFAILVIVTLPTWGRGFPHGYAGFAVVMALPAGLLRRRPLPVLALLLAESLSFTIAEPGHNDIALLQFLAADVALCFIAATQAPGPRSSPPSPPSASSPPTRPHPCCSTTRPLTPHRRLRSL